MIKAGPGILLIADPFLKDPNFLRTVVLICEHQEEGSFGLVLNKRFTHQLDELMTDLEGHPIPVYYGGPVEMNTLHFIHQLPEQIPGGKEIGSGIFWGGNFETVTCLVKSGELDLSMIKFFIGYSGWGKGQLQEELDEKSWLTVAATRKLIFEDPAEEVWKESLKHLGGDYEMLIHYPADPQLN